MCVKSAFAVTSAVFINNQNIRTNKINAGPFETLLISLKFMREPKIIRV